MTNLDELKSKKIEISTKFCAALKAEDAENVAKAFEEYGDMLLSEFQKAFDDYQQKNDADILTKAGIKQYTSAEKKAFQQIIDVAKDTASGVSVPAAALPVTFIDRLLKDILEESTLLKAINITNSGFLTTMILDDSEDEPATWTGMGETIPTANTALNTISVMAYKLAKIIFVPNEMLDMGPEWILSYVERKMKMCLRLGLETGVVDGNGSKGPIGMNRTKKNGTNGSGEYSKKKAVKVTSLKVIDYCNLIAKLVVNSKGKARNVEKVILVAHPTTILTKILPASTVRRPDGTYSDMNFAFPTVVIPSVAVDEDAGILGIYKKYEFFVGSGSKKESTITPDKSIGFKEHMTAIKIHMYGNGSFVDENDHIVLDFSELKPANQEVVIINDEDNPVVTKASSK